MKNYNEDLINQLIRDYQPHDILKEGVSGVIKYYCREQFQNNSKDI